MSTVYISADSLKPSNHAVEQAYYYGDGSSFPMGPPVLFDSAGDGESETLLPASNTQTTFVFGTNLYKLVNRQQSFGTVLVKSTDGGATWTVLDSANSPAFETCSGFLDSATSTVLCAYVDANGAGGNIHLIEFDLVAQTWGSPFAAVGPVAAQSASISVFRRTDSTVLVLYHSRDTFNAPDPSGLGAVVYDPIGGSWGSPFDAGANILALTGWDATQTIVQMANVRVTMDSATGIIHCFFTTTSIQTVPVVWGNRVFYQQILLNNSLGRFDDFPGQVAPFPPFPYDKQQLEAFTGPPFGQPVIVGSNIILPVSMRNDSVIDRFPLQVPNIYVGTPVAAPVWTLNATGTIDPGVLVDDFIWIQEAPSLTYDGSNLFAVYSAQDADGQNLARLRMVQTATPLTPTLGWTGQTIFDLQVDAPPGFNFATQFLSGAGAFSPLSSPPPPVTLTVFAINALTLAYIPLPDPKRC